MRPTVRIQWSCQLTKGCDEMIDIMKTGLDAQGHTIKANNDRLEEDDVMFPETEDFDSKADRLYEEAVGREINK